MYVFSIQKRLKYPLSDSFVLNFILENELFIKELNLLFAQIAWHMSFKKKILFTFWILFRWQVERYRLVIHGGLVTKSGSQIILQGTLIPILWPFTTWRSSLISPWSITIPCLLSCPPNHGGRGTVGALWATTACGVVWRTNTGRGLKRIWTQLCPFPGASRWPSGKPLHSSRPQFPPQ